jgi:diacylglycerol kinase family enzyme
MTVRRVVVYVNAAAGSVDGADPAGTSHRIAAAFTTASPDVEVRVETVDPSRLQDRIREVWTAGPRPDAVVVAGGDGTVNNAAQVAADSDIVIGVLPLGTFDHFAGDLGVPGDLEAAAAALVDGEIRRVDVAEVNGRVFVNNSLVGLYPRLVSIRDEVMVGRGWGKVRAVPVAAARVLGSFPTHRLDLTGPDGFGLSGLHTPMLFVGNGVYESAPGRPPTRSRLDAGVLGIEVARAASRRRLVRAAVHTLVRGASGATDVERATLETVEVHGRAARLQVAIDGEIDWFVPPLRYRTRPGALLVLAPRRPASP